MMNEPVALIDRKCTARSKRSRGKCQNYAVKGRSTCRMHGGTSRGPVTQEGKERSRQAVLKHGMYTKEAIQERETARQLLKLAKNG